MTVDSQIAELEKGQLIRRSAEEDLAYLFKHALTQETAYSSLLLRRRRDIHLRIAESYESLYSDRLEEEASLLAFHFSQAGNDGKTLQYATLAGDAAAQRFANVEAASSYDQALAAVSRLPAETVDPRGHIELILKRVAVKLRAEGPHMSLTHLREAERMALDLYGDAPAAREDKLQLARVQYWIAQANLHGNETAEAVSYLDRVIKVALEEEDDELRAIPESMLGRGMAVLGRFNEAEPHLRLAVELLGKVAANHEWFMANGMLGFTLAARGQYSEGLAIAELARHQAAEAGNMTALALCGMTLCWVSWCGNDLERLSQESENVIRTAEKAGDHLLAHIGHAFRAWAESRQGEQAAAAADMATSEEIGRRIGGRLVSANMVASAQMEMALTEGRIEACLTLAQELVQNAAVSGDMLGQGLAHRAWGKALAAKGPQHYDEADGQMAASLSMFESGDARLEAARTHVAWGELLQNCGNLRGARAHFDRALDQFHASGLRPEVEWVRSLMEKPKVA